MIAWIPVGCGRDRRSSEMPAAVVTGAGNLACQALSSLLNINPGVGAAGCRFIGTRGIGVNEIAPAVAPTEVPFEEPRRSHDKHLD